MRGRSCEVEGATIGLWNKRQAGYLLCHIVYRYHIYCLSTAYRQYSQLTLQHQLQHIIDGVEVACASGMAITHNHSGATDDVR